MGTSYSKRSKNYFFLSQVNTRTLNNSSLRPAALTRILTYIPLRCNTRYDVKGGASEKHKKLVRIRPHDVVLNGGVIQMDFVYSVSFWLPLLS